MGGEEGDRKVAQQITRQNLKIAGPYRTGWWGRQSNQLCYTPLGGVARLMLKCPLRLGIRLLSHYIKNGGNNHLVG